MSVSKKMRFEVFKRDGFRCAYCGRTPPDVFLECDHIVPRSDGGKDDINNLITACSDCNQGKSSIPLDQIPAQVDRNISRQKEAYEQLEALNQLQEEIWSRECLTIDSVEHIFQRQYPKRQLANRTRSSVRRFAKHFTEIELMEAMETACWRVPDNPDGAIRYFCGICWRRLKERRQRQ